MFNDLNASSPEGTKEVDDIFSDVDKTPTPAAMPTFSGTSPIQSQNQAPASSQVFPGAGKEAYLNVEDNMPAAGERGTKFLKIALILVVVAAIVSVAGYFVYTQLIEPEKKTNTPNNTPIVIDNNNPEDIQNMEEIINQQENNLTTTSDDLLNEVPTTTDVVELVDPLNPVNPEMEPISNEPISIEDPLEATVDTDGDGLNDQEETLAGTDINSVDTDGDGLSDYEEVKTYLTNPLSADTDGDTYPDGSEVEKGYNPNGEGKLETKV